MKVKLFEKSGRALLEVVVTTLIGVAPLFMAAFLYDAEHQTTLSAAGERFNLFISGGQLFLYAFSALGSIIWLWVANFRLAHIALRAGTGVMILAVLVTSAAVYIQEPDMRTPLAPWLVTLSTWMFLSCPLLNFLMLVLADERPPAPGDVFRRDADRISAKAEAIR